MAAFKLAKLEGFVRKTTGAQLEDKGCFPIQIHLIFYFHKKSLLKGYIPENVHVLSISDNNIT